MIATITDYIEQGSGRFYFPRDNVVAVLEQGCSCGQRGCGHMRIAMAVGKLAEAEAVGESRSRELEAMLLGSGLDLGAEHNRQAETLTELFRCKKCGVWHWRNNHLTWDLRICARCAKQ